VVFKRMMQAFGVGGPSVDTVLSSSVCQPGGYLHGEVHILGGDHQVEIEQVALGLVTRVEVESGDSEYETTHEFQRVLAAGAFTLPAGVKHAVPFQLMVPWETPITELYGHRLAGATMGVRTELVVARAVDKGDLDQVSVRPLPAQEQILTALVRLGFRFARADNESGRLHGVAQSLPFYQEIEFYPAPQYAGVINQLEVTFVATAEHLQVVLEVDRRGGLFAAGGDGFGRFTVDHASAATVDWAARLDSWLRESLQRRGLFH